MSELDKRFKIEANFWLSQIGECAEKRFASLLMDFLPTKDRGVALEAAHQRVNALTESGLFQFVGLGLQNNARTVVTWLGHMKSGRAPTFPTSTNDKFVTGVIAALACFIRAKRQKAGEGDTGPEMVHGRAAIEEIYTSMLARIEKGAKPD